jgi:hypothetical protein
MVSIPCVVGINWEIIQNKPIESLLPMCEGLSLVCRTYLKLSTHPSVPSQELPLVDLP